MQTKDGDIREDTLSSNNSCKICSCKKHPNLQ